MGIPDEVQGRVGEPKELDGLSDDDLKAVLKEYYDRYSPLKNTNWALESWSKVKLDQVPKLTDFVGFK